MLHFSVSLSCPTPSAFACCCSKNFLVSGGCEGSSEFQWQWQGLTESLLLLTFTATSSPGRSLYLERIFIFAVAKHDACLLRKDRGCAALSHRAENNISPDNPPLYTPICFRIKFCPSCLHYQAYSMLPCWLGLCRKWEQRSPGARVPWR